MSSEVIKELIRSGVITQETADKAMVKVDKTLQACAFTLHTLMCHKEHEESPEMLFQPTMNKCMWYVEDSLPPVWSAPDHVFWLERTIGIMKILEINDPEEMKEFLRKLAEASVIVRELVASHLEALKLLEEVVVF